ncbi:Signal transduction histidine kinase [Maridesulfovibrio ferrireducens]|uniref:histidine kinase n=2 Tax=Maridesulfovibrio ferrireducens TaxID=246191 RepID=A0A1G9BCL8_9BACT|nr:Signal transduction histidine kinase [Maridesulfovibrio ferrireducens]
MLGGCEPTDDLSPRAVQGVFDMRDHSLSAGETVNLDGEWEFYWDQLLTPDNFISGSSKPEMTGYFLMHRAWNKFNLNGKRLGGTGQATFRLRLLPNRPAGRIHLRLFDIHEAYRLWANGKLIAQSGVPGRSAETEVPGGSLKLAEIEFQSRPVELVLQVSNHHFRIGGVPEPIRIALPGTLETIRARDWGIALFFAGCMLIMGIYHFVLYLFRKRDKAPLYFSLYCLLVVSYSVTSNTSQWVASAILPWWNPVIMENFSLTCFVIWASLLFRFLETLYPNEFHHKLVYFLDAKIVIFFFMMGFAPGVPLYWFIALCLVQMMIYAGYYLHRLLLCVKRGRSGALFLLAGLSSQFFVGLNDTLTHMGIIKSTYLAEPAVCFFVLTQSLALAQRFSASFDSVEHLSLELESKNISLCGEIKERNRLERKVVETSEEERRRISHELHDGLCQQLTGARLRSSALAHKFKDSDDAQTLIDLADLLKESTDDAYKTARGLWPIEHDASMPGPSLNDLLRGIAKSTDINVTFDKQSHCKKCLNPNMTKLYRIAQEALTNAAKHSKAQNIRLTLHCHGNGQVKLSVQDDGIGRKAAGTMHGGLGMSIMAHRAKLINAELRIENDPQGGTVVTCVAPCSVHELSRINQNGNENE